MTTVIKAILDKPSKKRARITLITPNRDPVHHDFSLVWMGDSNARQAVYWSLELYYQDRSTWPKELAIRNKATELGWFTDQGPANDRLKKIGSKLYSTVFGSSGIENTLAELLRQQEDKKDIPIIQLHIPDEGSALQAYPWELLHDDHDFLFYPERALLVRRVDFNQSIPTIQLDKALNVLLIDPRPDMSVLEIDNLPILDRRQLEQVAQAMPTEFIVSNLPEILPEESTLAKLSRYLRTGRETPNILHIDTHGGFGWLCKCSWLNAAGAKTCKICQTPKAKDQPLEGYLVLEDEKGAPVWISGERLGKQLYGRSIQVVVLSACKSGVVGGPSTFNSVAGALIKQGIPAVVAMQFSIDNHMAAIFAENFYLALRSGESTARAIAEARQGLAAHNDDSWYRPVLYLRNDSQNPEGQLFSVKGKQISTSNRLATTRSRTLPWQKYASKFVGREKELNDLQILLLNRNGSSDSRCVAVVGSAGIGKSALAAHFAWLHQKAFLDRPISLSVGDKDADTVARDFIREYGEKIDPEQDPIDFMQGILAKLDILLILDNVKTPKISKLFAGENRSAIIITTRDRGWTSRLEINKLELSPLPNQDAIKLLEKYLRIEKIPNELEAAAQEIIKLVGGLPLALRIIGSNLNEDPGGLARYAGWFQKQKERLLIELQTEEEELNVRASLDWSFQSLEKEEQEFLASLSACAESGFSEAAAMAVYNCADEYKVYKLLERLYNLSLLDSAQFREPRYVFQPLVHLFASDQAEKLRLQEIASARHARYFIDFFNQNRIPITEELDNLILAAKWLSRQETLGNDDYSFILCWLGPLFEEYGHWPEATELMKSFALLAEKQAKWDNAVQLHIQTARYLSLAGELSEAEQILQAVNEVMINRIEPYRNRQSNEAMLAKAFAGVFERQNYYEKAIERLQQSENIFRLLDDQANLTVVLNSLGALYKRQGDLDKAEKTLLESMSLAESQGNQRQLVKTLNTLSSVLKRKKKYSEARKHLHRCLEICRALNDRRSLTIVLNTLGSVCKLEREYDKALEYLQECLVISEQLGDRSNLAKILNNLGGTHRGLGNTHEALGCLRRSLEISQALGDQTSQGITLEGLGKIYLREKNFDDALNSFQKSLECYKNPGDRSKQANIHYLLGTIYQIQTHYAEAIDFFEDSAAGYAKLKNKQEEAAKAFNKLGRVYLSCRKISGAHGAFKNSYKIYKRLGEEYKHELADVTNNLGSCFLEQKDYERAIQAFNHRCLILKELDRPHSLAITLYKLGNACLKNKSVDQAVLAFEESRTQAEKLDTLRPHLRRVLCSLSFAYRKQEKLNQTVKVLQDLCILFEELEEKGRPSLAKILRILGHVQKGLKNYDKAVNALECSRNILVELGYPKYYLALVLNDLGSVLKDQGKYDAAVKTLEQSREILTQLEDPKGKLAVVFNTLGSTWRKQGECEKAIQAFQCAIEIDKRLGNHRHIAMILRNYVMTLEGQYHRLDEIIAALWERCTIFNELGNQQDLAKDLCYLGDLYYYEKRPPDYENAAEAYRRSAEINKTLGYKEHQAKVLHKLGNVYRDLKYWPEAIDTLKCSLEIFVELNQLDNQLELAALHFVMGKTLLSSGTNIQAAKEHFRKSFEINEAHKAFKEQYVVEELIKACFRLGQREEALAYCQRALAIAPKDEAVMKPPCLYPQ